jgi:hypothetical protein
MRYLYFKIVAKYLGAWVTLKDNIYATDHTL